MEALSAPRGALFAAVCAVAMISSATAGSLSLTPGIVVAPELTRAYAATPDGHVQAIELDGGRVDWISRERGLPLALVDGRLVALGSVEQFGLGMLLLIDPATGDARDRIAFDLPEEVSADLLPKPSRTFSATVVESGSGVRLYWSYRGRPLRGALLTRADGEPESNEGQTLEGAVDLVLGGSRAYAVTVSESVSYPLPVAPDLAAGEQLPGIEGRQFRAVDGAHVLATQAQEIAGSQHHWTVYARSGGAALGSLSSVYAYAPFVVSGTQLVYRAAPSQQVSAADRQTELRTRLVGFDLRDERERWSVPVLDFFFRGPYPP